VEMENKKAVAPTSYSARITEIPFRFILRLVTEAFTSSTDDFNT
jgi:hypothetical protein